MTITNKKLALCVGCKLPTIEEEIINLDFGRLVGKFCRDCAISTNNKATKDEDPKTKELNRRFVKELKEYNKLHGSINYETFELICRYVYDGDFSTLYYLESKNNKQTTLCQE